ncbi:VOC family protein [Pedobacter jejuensis]|uniref:VOC family protein n=1 Tax=Pedobacter jejuensis TaxID=1268550 RepID=A0A3N0BV25_9SPHI|nr:VOC family protein [Pedobacter jejuensis]RNL53211.1 VOC family protein [Pedobacter jejuensis]
MLKNSKAFSSFAVNDIQKAKEFYQDTLGLKVVDNPMGLIELKVLDSSNILIYPKPNHEPATFTVLNFPVENINDVVDKLIEKGISFEQYDEEYLKTNEKGISSGTGGPSIAWFKDPSGNILSILEVGK